MLHPMIYQVKLGTFPASYADSLQLQRTLSAEVLALSTAQPLVGHLLLGEHSHVYTLGKHGMADNMLMPKQWLDEHGIAMVRTDRGGDITYHGPGQLVGYPIINLLRLNLGAREYIAKLMVTVQQTALDFDVECHPRSDAPGLWIGEGDNQRKLCAVGVHIGQGISTHGFALNVSTDLSYFARINPCGFKHGQVASLQGETCKTITLDEIKLHFCHHFCDIFALKIIE